MNLHLTNHSRYFLLMTNNYIADSMDPDNVLTGMYILIYSKFTHLTC